MESKISSAAYEASKAAMPQTVSPLQTALNEHGDQIDKLSGFLSDLESRLIPVKNSVPREDNSDVGEQSLGGSTIFNQVTSQTRYVRNLQSRIVVLLEELEV